MARWLWTQILITAAAAPAFGLSTAPVMVTDSPPTVGADCYNSPTAYEDRATGDVYYCDASTGKWAKRGPNDGGTAADLTCTGCVDTADIASGAVTIGALTTGTVLAPSYAVQLNGSNYEALDEGGNVAFSGTDPGAVINSAIDALSSTGGQVVLKGAITYTSTVPDFPPSTTQWIRVTGDGATITLASGANRAFALDKQADGDVFRRIIIEHLVIDNNNVSGDQNVIFGTRTASGGDLTKVGVEGIIIRDVVALNVVTDPSGADNQSGIRVNPVGARGDATASFVRDILVENVRIEGGNAGIQVAVGLAATPTSGAVPSGNVVERVTVRDCYHTTGSVPTAFFASTNYHIGGSGAVYTDGIVLDGNYGEGAGDNGIEVNGPITAQITNNVIKDMYNVGMTITNFDDKAWGDPDGDGTDNAPLVGKQWWYISGNSIQVENVSLVYGGSGGSGYSINNTSVVDTPAGSVYLVGNRYLKSTADAATNAAIYVKNDAANVVIDDFEATWEDVEYDETASVSPVLINLSSDRAGATFTVSNVKLNWTAELLAAAESGGGSVYARGILINGADVSFDVDGVEMVVNMTNFDAAGDRFAAIEIGHSYGSNAVMSGHISNVRVQDNSGGTGDENPIALRFGSSLVPGWITVSDCDFSELTDNGNLLLFDDSANDERYIEFRNVRPNNRFDSYWRSWGVVEEMWDCNQWQASGRLPGHLEHANGGSTEQVKNANVSDADPPTSTSGQGVCLIQSGVLANTLAGLFLVQATAESITRQAYMPEKMQLLTARARDLGHVEKVLLIGGLRSSVAHSILDADITDGIYFWCYPAGDNDGDGTAGDQNADGDCGDAGEDADDCDWFGVTKASSTATKTATGTSCVGGAYHEFRIEHDNIDGETRFHVDDSLAATNTTNQPAGAALAGYGAWVETTDTTQNYLYLDWIYYRGRR